MDHTLPSLAICICTSGRPFELVRCLESIQAGTQLPDEVIVSDDSQLAATVEQIKSICDHYLFVRYVEGPRRGLCANRNHVISKASNSHISLLDDDAVVSPMFVETIRPALGTYPSGIITGDVVEDGTKKVPPTNPTYLGHFGRNTGNGEKLASINLNCNAFPRSAFSVAQFDERIRYGYEDMDLCSRLASAGFEIIYVESLFNTHLPPPESGSQGLNERTHLTERARLYTSLKRYFFWNKQPAIGLSYIAVAPAHLLVSGVRRYGVVAGISFLLDAFWPFGKFVVSPCRIAATFVQGEE